MRKTNRKARADEAPARISHEDAIRLAKSVAPPRLSSTQLDPVTGHIQYPLVLQDSIFTPYRSELDSLFASRASSGSGLQFKDFQAIRKTVTKFMEVLKEHVKDYPSSEYGKGASLPKQSLERSQLSGWLRMVPFLRLFGYSF